MRRFRALIAGLTTAIGLSATVPAAAENVVRWASTTGALTIDPHAYDETPTWAQLRQVYEPLIGFDSNLDLVPGLAVAWRLVEPTVWEFELRPNARFHDGTLLTAADVVFSFARTRTELPISPGTQIESIAAVRAIDEHTVRIETRFPDPGLQEKVRRTYIMSERWAAAHDAQVPVNLGVGEENYASRHANGTGPFILKEFEPNGPVVMVRNPDWWGFERYPHNIDRIEYRPITDPKERLVALLRGDLDLLTDPPFDALEQIRSTPGLKLAQANEPRIIYLGLDQSRAELRSSDAKGRNPFSDKRVRQAIYQAIDIETIRDEVMQSLATPAGMMVAPAVNGYAPELDQRLPYDPQAAKALLAAAGYAKGFSVVLDCPNNRYINDEAICRAIAAQLHEVGIELVVNAQPRNVIFAKVDNRESDFYLLGFAPGTLDSHEMLRVFYRTQGDRNGPGYSNPQVDQLIDQIDRTMITYARDAMIEDVWRIVLGDIVYVPLHSQVIVWAMRDNLELPVYPFNQPIFREARLTPPKVN